MSPAWFPSRADILEALRRLREQHPGATVYADLGPDAMTFLEHGKPERWLCTLNRSGEITVRGRRARA